MNDEVVEAVEAEEEAPVFDHDAPFATCPGRTYAVYYQNGHYFNGAYEYITPEKAGKNPREDAVRD